MTMPSPSIHPSRTAPLCGQCKHYVSLRSTCNHPSTPACPINGGPTLSIHDMRTASPSLARLRDITPCGPDGKLFEVRDGLADAPQGQAKPIDGIAKLPAQCLGCKSGGAGLQVSPDQGGVCLSVSITKASVDAGDGLVQPAVNNTARCNL